MKRLLVALCVLVAVAAASPGQAQAGQCGLPSRSPLWIDFADGSVPFWHLFAKPGVIGAASNLLFPPQLRAEGAKTIYWDMYLNNRIGNPLRPAKPETVLDWADRMYYRAVASSGCATPWIALNELFGASTTTPWTPSNARYRANVLLYLQRLSGRGARPFLLVPTEPYTAEDAGMWWKQVALVADIVREVYFPAPRIHRLGPVVGSRRMRMAFRQGIRDFTELGLPPNRLGLFLGFHTSRGAGGREGLERMAWFRHAKLQALAARQVSNEIPFFTIWSWGWGHWGSSKPDPDKEIAACVYLWTRDARLCNAPAMAGPTFNADLTEGQILLPRGVRCEIAGVRIGSGEIAHLGGVVGDRQAAFTALAARAAVSAEVPVTANEIVDAEASVIRSRFRGSVGAYRAALARAGANLGIARGVLADELREAKIEARLRVRSPSGREIGEYYRTYGRADGRAVEVRPAPWWLDYRTAGVAVETIAPAPVFRAPTGKVTKIQTRHGIYKVRPLGRPAPLATFPLGRALGSIKAAITTSMRGEAYQKWLLRKQKSAVENATCRRDELPALGAVDLTNYLPFLELAT